MRITQTLLQQYLEADATIKKLEAQKYAVREALLALEGSDIVMGDFKISKKEITRIIPMKIEEIREILGPKADEILRESKSVRVEVKKVS